MPGSQKADTKQENVRDAFKNLFTPLDGSLMKTKATDPVTGVSRPSPEDNSLSTLEVQKKSSETPRPHLKCNEKLELAELPNFYGKQETNSIRNETKQLNIQDLNVMLQNFSNSEIQTDSPWRTSAKRPSRKHPADACKDAAPKTS